MSNFGDEKQELQEIAKFFHIDGLEELQTKLFHEYYKTLKMPTEEDAINARELMTKKATYFGISDYSNFAPLERRIMDFDLSYRTVCGIVYDTREQADLNKELYNFYKTLDLTSTKKAALEAIKSLEKKAEKLNISAEWLSPYTNAALKEIQKKAWKSLDEFYKTLDLNDEVKAIAARQIITEKAEELEIDNFTSYPPLEGLITQFDELAKTAFEYRFKTREEAQSAVTDETVFFKTVYTCIAEFIRQTSGMKRWNEIAADKQISIKDSLSLTDQPFAFVDSTFLGTGKNGLAITPSGIFWNNGSALLENIAGNVVFKTLFKKKSQEMIEKHKVNAYNVTWKEFFCSNTKFSIDEKKMITITPDKQFEASHTKAEEICSVFQKIHNWGKTVKFEFSGAPVPVPNESSLCAAPKLTEIPSSIKIDVPKVIAPFPDNTVLLQNAAKYRKGNDNLMIAPEIPEELYKNFLNELEDDLQKKASKEIAICQADHTLMFKNGKKGFLLTNDTLYYHNDNEFSIELSDIIGVDGSDSNVVINCADGSKQVITGKGGEVLKKLLESLLKKK